MTIVSDSVLIESRTARDNQLEHLSHERATEALNRAKAFVDSRKSDRFFSGNYSRYF